MTERGDDRERLRENRGMGTKEVRKEKNKKKDGCVGGQEKEKKDE